MMISNKVVEDIVKHVQTLCKACYPEYKFHFSFITIFSQSDEEYEKLRSKFTTIGEEQDANNGVMYKLNTSLEVSGESIKEIRIRKPDIHRSELGCADLIYAEDDYLKLRDTALDKGFDVILRKGYEMIELSDFNIPVYAYIVKDI